MAETTKIWWKSKGIWAGALTFFFGIYGLVKISFPQFHLPDLTNYLPVIFTVLGALGFYGRKEADGKIVFSDVKGN